MKHANKVFIVTGGSGLIGKAIIEKLRSEGAITINADIINHKENLDQNYHIDINDADSVKSVITKVLDTYGALDGFVNNAYPKTKNYGKNSFMNVPHQEWNEFVNNNLNGYYLCAYYALEAMKKANKGSLINVASIYGFLAPDFNLYEGTEMNFPGEYTIVKGGIINFTRYLSALYGSYGLRVNCISPGGVFNHQNDLFLSRYNKKVFLNRMAEPHEIASPISFLLSNDASYITGHNLVVDGGVSLA